MFKMQASMFYHNDKTNYVGAIALLDINTGDGRGIEIHINIEKPSKEIFSMLYIWLHDYIVPEAREQGFVSITCDDSGTCNPKLIQLFKDFGFKTRTITEGEIKL